MDVPRDLNRRDVLAVDQTAECIALLGLTMKVRSVDRHDQRAWRLECDKR